MNKKEYYLLCLNHNLAGNAGNQNKRFLVNGYLPFLIESVY